VQGSACSSIMDEKASYTFKKKKERKRICYLGFAKISP
jgi:hypothetical protein